MVTEPLLPTIGVSLPFLAYLTPISRALAQTLERHAGSAAPNLPSASLRCIPAPQNYICFAPLILVPLNDVWFFELEEVSSRPPLHSGTERKRI